MAAPARSATARSVLSRYRPRWQPERAETRVICSIRASLAPCTGLALLRSLRTHSDAAAIALPNPAARTQLYFLSWIFVLCSLAGTFLLLFLRHASPRQLARTLSTARLATPARTRTLRAHGRCPATNDTTCGPPEWLTGKLQDEGTRSVRSPPRRPPLLATPIATPLQGGRPERSGLLFLKLLFFWLHVKKRTKKHVFSLWRGATASNRQAKLGLDSGRG